MMVCFFTFSFTFYFLQTSGRILFNKAFFPFDELISYCFVLAALSGAVYNIHLGDNISISLLQKISKHKVLQIVLDSVSFLVSLLMFYVFYVYFLNYTSDSLAQKLYIFPYVYLFFVAIFSYLFNIVITLRQSK